MQVAVGARQRIEKDWQLTARAYGHLFLNLTGNVVMSAAVLGSSADQTAQTLCGRIVPELKAFPPLPFWRRLLNTLPCQLQFEFPEISVGMPQPLEPREVDKADGILTGRPASRGVVEGIVRVAHTLAEAAQLQPGEILVTPITERLKYFLAEMMRINRTGH